MKCAVAVRLAKIESRVWSQIQKSDGCWLWTGSVNVSGYAQFTIKRQTVRTHRWVYQKLIGPVPWGQMLLHSCHNRRCVNPAHLRPGTHQDNMRDMVAAGRSLKGDRNPMRQGDVAKKNGAARRGEKHPLARLTAADVAEIRKLIAEGGTVRGMAAAFGVSPSNISHIIAGRTWAYALE